VNYIKEPLVKKSSLLKDKKIILGVTGSISAVESVRLIHELKRHGADVFPVMTESAKKIVNPNSLEYASENKVVTELTGSIEHVKLVDSSDLFLVAPATANSISKMSLGIDDTTVTSVFSNALEKIPVLLSPAMHQNMYSNPIISKNIGVLKSYGVKVLDPIFEESKAKISDIETIVAETIRAIHSELRGKKVCIIGGSSIENIDDVRIITNNSSGETSVELAKMAYFLGADTDLYFGNLRVQVPPFLKFKQFTNVDSIMKEADSIKKNDIIIVPAALSDFSPVKKEGKISSDGGFTMRLNPTPKLLKNLRDGFDGKIVGFKAEFGVTEKELIRRAEKRLKEYSLDGIVANDLKDVKKGTTKVIVLSGNRELKFEGEKSEVARKILESFA
jgi:phosphopantothenoylcysteine decarboxylase/phosphopantothenate--cysteine ligase